MYIGNIVLPHGLVLGPMAGYTDAAMRAVCHSHGAELTVTEMISAKAVCYSDRKTAALARIDSDEGVCALQLFGSEPQCMAEATERLLREHTGKRPDIIDINMGCPMRKIVTNGEGSALMSDPRLIERIVRAVCAAADVPVTVKLRAGRTADSLNAPECARAAESGGAAAVTVHGRTAAQLYGGKADRRIIALVKEAVSIPVIGNGDIRCGADALSMMADTGCDGVMVGRGAVGNPFIFREIACAMDGLPYSPPTDEQRLGAAMEQLSRSICEKGERSAVLEHRKQLALFISGTPGSADMRRRINSATTAAELRQIATEFLKK